MTFNIDLPAGKKIYFASDFHLGAPNHQESIAREKKLTKWLSEIAPKAHTIFFLGDIFDFWYEYKHAIPRGFARFQGKIAELVDNGIKVYFLSGNHDMWMFGYFPKELGVEVIHGEHEIVCNDKSIYIGHGDGLGEQDFLYKYFLKKFFRNKVCQWLFARIHPNLGITIAHAWSEHSRMSNNKKADKFYGEGERMLKYCKEVEEKKHHDYYVLGHRHMKMKLPVSENSTYFNLGDWLQGSPYGIFDGQTLEVLEYDNENIH